MTGKIKYALAIAGGVAAVGSAVALVVFHKKGFTRNWPIVKTLKKFYREPDVSTRQGIVK